LLVILIPRLLKSRLSSGNAERTIRQVNRIAERLSGLLLHLCSRLSNPQSAIRQANVDAVNHGRRRSDLGLCRVHTQVRGDSDLSWHGSPPLRLNDCIDLPR
jgi:hypothetical protein